MGKQNRKVVVREEFASKNRNAIEIWWGVEASSEQGSNSDLVRMDTTLSNPST